MTLELALRLLLVLGFFGAAAAQASNVDIQSIYGVDDRQDLYQVYDSVIQSRYRTVVGIFDPEYFTKTEYGIRLAPITPAIELNICPTEPFAHQISAASCTGSLVAPNVVLTAGHCVSTKKECGGAAFAFDYNIPFAGYMPTYIPTSKVYYCKRIIARENKWSGMDYAFIELDRPVYDRSPAQYLTTKPLETGDSLFVVGHPIGLPAKSAVGTVKNTRAHLVESDLDTFKGNSGSPVFDTKTGLMVGVLVQGSDDFVEKDGCKVAKVCTPKTCVGEYVLRITSILESYKKKIGP